MADLPPYSDSSADTGDDVGVGPDPGLATATPLWVKVFGIIALLVVLLFIILTLAGGGNHGPGRHTGGGDQAPTSGVTEHRARVGDHAP